VDNNGLPERLTPLALPKYPQARYIKIREDLERSHQMFPAQKYRLTVTSNHEFGFDVNKRTKQQMRSARIHSKPRVSSSITKFADQYYKIQGTSPYAKDSSKRKKVRQSEERREGRSQEISASMFALKIISTGTSVQDAPSPLT